MRRMLLLASFSFLFEERNLSGTEERLTELEI